MVGPRMDMNGSKLECGCVRKSNDVEGNGVCDEETYSPSPKRTVNTIPAVTRDGRLGGGIAEPCLLYCNDVDMLIFDKVLELREPTMEAAYVDLNDAEAAVKS